MLHSVANNKPSDVHFHVVSAYLIKDLLVDGNVRCFVFHNHNRACFRVVDNSITTLLCIVKIEGDLVGDTGGVVSLLVDEIMNEVLANPLFGRKDNVFFAQNVKNCYPISFSLEL